MNTRQSAHPDLQAKAAEAGDTAILTVPRFRELMKIKAFARFVVIQKKAVKVGSS